MKPTISFNLFSDTDAPMASFQVLVNIYVSEHQQKTFVCYLKGVGWGMGTGSGGRGLSESIKKGKFVTKFFFR